MTTTVLDFCTPPVPGERHKYYGDVHNKFIKLPINPPAPTQQPPPAPAVKHVAPATLKRQKTLHAIAASGNLTLFKQILALHPNAANEMQASTGLRPIHFAASRGNHEIVRCLIEEYGADVDIRDHEGETPLLKASYGGYFHVVQYLLLKKANLHHKDKDGWTALHNACSRGNLPIVRMLVERGARVDVQNKTGHTPLVNAASKGHVSVVEYLLEEADANPLIKNNFQEAAYDVSAASGESGEAYICEMLQKAEAKWWHTQNPGGSTYDLYDFHVTVMVILHENQRSSSLLGLSRPQFSPNSSKHDQRGPWSRHPSGEPTTKDKVMLPRSSDSEGSKWFWLTDWQVDYSDPRVDPTSGWQYARSFNEPDERWTPVAPTGGYGWVRRRRWVRVMKRRMDLARGRLIQEEVQDTWQRDYVQQAEDLVQNAIEDNNNNKDAVNTPQELTRELRVYEEAVQQLLSGMKADSNQHRKHQATILVTAFTARIDALNTRIAQLGPQLSTPVAPVHHNAELARELGFSKRNSDNNSTQEEDGFVQSASDLDTNPWSRDSALPTSERIEATIASTTMALDMDFGGGSSSDASPNLPFDQKSGPRTYNWEPDVNVKECRRCARRFGLINRRHHCRRCGLVVCDKCSSSRTYLNPSEILQDPTGPFESLQVLASQHHRVCDKCYADLGRE